MDKPFDRFGPSTCIPDDPQLRAFWTVHFCPIPSTSSRLVVQFNPLAHPLWPKTVHFGLDPLRTCQKNIFTVIYSQGAGFKILGSHLALQSYSKNFSLKKLYSKILPMPTRPKIGVFYFKKDGDKKIWRTFFIIQPFGFFENQIR